MSRAYTKDIRVLAVDPSTRGFGFAILEGPNRLIDWGVKETKVDKNRMTMKLVADLIERYQPNVIVVEDYRGKGSRRCRRIQGLINDISKLAAKQKILHDVSAALFLVRKEAKNFLQRKSKAGVC
jgi:RNase H-fold protein (predicted Holliday junction resolvase)